MTDSTSHRETVHRWYTRPVLFVADVNHAARFYVDVLGFEKSWHEGDGAGTVCPVNHGECEIILCEDVSWGSDAIQIDDLDGMSCSSPKTS